MGKEQDLARRLSPRFADVLESIARAKGEEYAIAIERSLKTIAAVSQLGSLASEKDRPYAEILEAICVDNISKLVTIIGIDNDDLRGAIRTSVADLNDLRKESKE